MEATELKQGDIAIIDYLKFSQPKKVEVLEETETTYFLHDLDFEKGRGYLIDADAIPSNETAESIIEEFKNQKLSLVQKDDTHPHVEVLAAKFRITKEEFEKTYKVIEVISTIESRAKEHQKLVELLNSKD